MTETSIALLPAIQELIRACATDESAGGRISRLPEAIEAFNDLIANMPISYGWHFKTADQFTKQVRKHAEAGAPARDVNSLYWRDLLGNIEAYSVMSVWRMRDLARSVLTELERDNVIAACIVARSAFESAVQLAHDARTVSATLDGVRTHDMTSQVLISTDLEEEILKTVFASRLSDADEIYKGKNILTIIGKIGKIAPSDHLSDRYELLCEVTHPNFLGRSVYLVEQRESGLAGDEIRVIAMKGGSNSAVLVQAGLWALSWSLEAQCAATHLQQQSIAAMFDTFPQLRNRTTH
jgi:hypothetical protein